VRSSKRYYSNNLQARLIWPEERGYTPRQAKKKRMRAALESLLRARKLDVTLTAGDAPEPPDRVAPTGDADLDAALGGGLRRGHLSEIVGVASSGRSTLVARMLAAATARGEATAIVDTCDTWDPASAAAHGVALERVLWVRVRASLAREPRERSEAAQRRASERVGESEGRSPADDHNAIRALRAFSLVLQAGGFGLVVLDLADVPPIAIRRFPHTTWMRTARLLENAGRETVALLVGAERIARSAGGATLALETSRAHWRGATSRARLFTGVDPAPRVVKPR
jgi:recombination protein RecA